jgi:hypothetical protein
MATRVWLATGLGYPEGRSPLVHPNCLNADEQLRLEADAEENRRAHALGSRCQLAGRAFFCSLLGHCPVANPMLPLQWLEDSPAIVRLFPSHPLLPSSALPRNLSGGSPHVLATVATVSMGRTIASPAVTLMAFFAAWTLLAAGGCASCGRAGAHSATEQPGV